MRRVIAVLTALLLTIGVGVAVVRLRGDDKGTGALCPASPTPTASRSATATPKARPSATQTPTARPTP